jgi:glutathionyl-hydroquinone reductase
VRINAVVYENLNDGVYRAGFATTRSAYEAALERLFETLDDLEAHLSARRSRGPVPTWLREKMIASGYDPANKDQREECKTSRLQLAA